MDAKLEPENQDFDNLNMQGDNPPPYEARGQNPHHVGYDQPSDPRSYNLPQHSLRMQMANSTVVSVQPVQPAPTVFVGHPRGQNLTIPSMFICFFCCWFTGVFAIIFAIKAQGLYDEGKIAEAQQKQRWTRNLMIASVIIPVIIYLVLWILYFVVFKVAMTKADGSLSESVADLTTRAPTWG